MLNDTPKSLKEEEAEEEEEEEEEQEQEQEQEQEGEEEEEAVGSVVSSNEEKLSGRPSFAACSSYFRAASSSLSKHPSWFFLPSTEICTCHFCLCLFQVTPLNFEDVCVSTGRSLVEKNSLYFRAASSSLSKYPRKLYLPPTVICACHFLLRLLHVTPVNFDDFGFFSGNIALSADSASEAVVWFANTCIASPNERTCATEEVVSRTAGGVKSVSPPLVAAAAATAAAVSELAFSQVSATSLSC
jgi:hypothetical protein